MKKIMTLAACAALAACSQAEAPAEEEAVVEAPVEEESMAGAFEATAEDGSTSTTVLDADGNYTETAADGTVSSGTVAMVNGQTCFNSSEEGAAPDCWTDGEAAEDGSWVATNDDGVSVTVRKVEAAAAAE